MSSRNKSPHRRKNIHPGPMSRTQKSRIKQPERKPPKRRKFRLGEIQFPGNFVGHFDPKPVKKLFGRRLNRFNVYDEVMKKGGGIPGG